MHPFFEDGAIFGRKAANAGLLRELLRTDPFDAYHFFLRDRAAGAHLDGVLRKEFPTLVEAGRVRIRPVGDLPAALGRYDYACFHLSDWVGDFIDLSILRNVYSRKIFPITAPVHTLSYARYGAAFLRHIWPGVTGRDRIIATSEATREVICAYFSQLRDGYGLAESLPAPSVERIPLGVEPELFASPEHKKSVGDAYKKKTGLPEDRVVFLSFSRISYLSKMDFLPIFDAFRRAFALGLPPESCHFVLGGRMDGGDPLGGVLTRLAREAGVHFSLDIFPDGPDDERRKALFAAADVFLSPVDNIQETFGLTPLEAFAASLPVIASAVDGYKELIVEGENGFLIPTVGPSSAEASTVASVLPPVDLYHLYLAQQCVVESAPFAHALHRLGMDADLRLSMGRRGRECVLTRWTWNAVVAQYLELWQRLGAHPLSPEEERLARLARHPSLPDYMRIFSGYFSSTADDPALRERLVRVSPKGERLVREGGSLETYALIVDRVDARALEELLRRAERATPFAKLADACAQPGRGKDRDFLLLWALKHDLLEFVS